MGCTRRQALEHAACFATHVGTAGGIIPIASWLGEAERPKPAERWRVRFGDAVPHESGFLHVGDILEESWDGHGLHFGNFGLYLTDDAGAL
jgi:hypothetical protein